MPEGQKEEQEIENLFEEIMKEYFSSLAKELDFQEVQEAQTPKEAGPKEEHTKAHHNYITQDETEGENLRNSKRKGHSYYKGLPIRLSADFSKQTLQARRGWQEVFQVMKGKGLHPRLLYPAKHHLEWKGR